MSIIIFIIILGILIFIHELGHFLAAKKTGMRVDEFAVGFKPAIWKKKKGETEYILGIIPIGGYVKIFGENPESEDYESKAPDADRAFFNRPKWAQALVLLAGVSFNILLAWVVLSLVFVLGAKVEGTELPEKYILSREALILGIASDSPAEKAELEEGSKVLSIKSQKNKIEGEAGAEALIAFIRANRTEPLLFVLENPKEEREEFSLLAQGESGEEKVGILIEDVAEVRVLNPVMALWYGGKSTVVYTIWTAEAFYNFLKETVVGKADFSQISGPVGIVKIVDSAAEKGFQSLLHFLAIISINLAIINALPFPALDGGRLLFVVIEAIIRRPIKPVVANTLNLVGFALLILLMLAVTYNDIVNLF